MQLLLLSGLISIVLLLPIPSHSKDTLESLKARQAKLQQELEEVRRRIETLESKEPSTADTTSSPTWYITSWGIDEVNSAGGVEPWFVIYNPNEVSPIKYMRIHVRVYNAVGDVVASDIGGRVSSILSYTGPLSHADGNRRVDWGPVLYNSTAHCIKVDTVQITFMNGKSLNFTGPTLRRAINPTFTNECKPS